MQSEADQVAERAIRATKTNRLSRRAKDVALVAILLLPEEEDGAYPHRVVQEYRKRNPKLNPFFIAFVLPILASLISHWLERWILKRPTGVRKLRAEAFDLIG